MNIETAAEMSFRLHVKGTFSSILEFGVGCLLANNRSNGQRVQNRTGSIAQTDLIFNGLELRSTDGRYGEQYEQGRQLGFGPKFQHPSVPEKAISRLELVT